ncbi:MAG: CAP domain-containing protein [Patescibacteria group bacterium]|nr:CAP domain-containing protein [Patescibacteria group bacterium]
MIILIVLTGVYRFSLNFGQLAETASIDSYSLMEKINNERDRRNIPRLVTSHKLSAAASAKTDDMFARGYFDHVDPDGHYVWPLVEAADYKPYRMLGENLAIDFSTEDGIIRAWIDSPTHRDNMFRSDFLDQGLNSRYGTFQSRYTNLVTSLFGTLVSAAPKTENPPPAAAPVPIAAPASPHVPAAAPATAETAETTPPAPMLGQNEPAVALTETSETAPRTQNASPALDVVTPKNLATEDVNVYETVRTIFLAFVILLFGSVLTDFFIRGSVPGPWKGRGFPVLILLVVATILTFNLY